MRGQPLIRYRTHDLVRLWRYYHHGCRWSWTFLGGGVLGRADFMVTSKRTNIYSTEAILLNALDYLFVAHEYADPGMVRDVARRRGSGVSAPRQRAGRPGRRGEYLREWHQVGLDGMHAEGRESVLEFDVALIDVDPFFIHYTTYTNWMDRGFMLLLKTLGHPLHTILEEGYGFPIVQCHIEYAAPANLDDHLRLTTRIQRLGRTSLVLAYDFTRLEPDGRQTPLVRAQTVHVCTDRATKRPRELPSWLRDRMPAAE